MWYRYRNGGTGSYTALRLEGILFREKRTSDRVSERTLRGYLTDKRLGGRRAFTVTISADELFGPTNTNRDFLVAFLDADERQFHPTNPGTEPATGWLPVMIEGGDLDFEYVDDHTYLPQKTFTMYCKEPL